MTQSPSAKIVFTPSGIRGEVSIGTDILSAAQQLGADLDTACGGIGACARCKVRPGLGEFPKYQISSNSEHLSALASAEQEQLNKTELAEGFRLGCSTRILGDLVVDIPAESQSQQQVVRKAAAELEIEAKPAVELVTTEVAEPRLNAPSGDLERLRDAVEFETGYVDLEIEPTVLTTLQQALRQSGEWQVTVAIYNQSRLITIWPGEQQNAYGVAIDIGSTTIAGHLCDLSDGQVLASGGMMNPQIRFGEDVMSRVSYSMMNEGGAKEMTDAVRAGLGQLIDQLVKDASIEREFLLDVTLVGNPIMHHLLLGIDPVELGGAPFALATQESVSLPASALNLNLISGAKAYVLPCIAGHVGADAAAVALAETPYKQAATTLIIDVGTNAEILLGNKDRLLAASSPTGPAFEGAQITHGQRAAPGAIERVRIDGDTLEPRFKIIGSDFWSDAPEFEVAAKQTGVTGLCGSGIIEVIASLYLAGVIRADGIIDGAQSSRSSRIEANGKTWSYRLTDKIIITQNDVRSIQLAKATLYASAKLLMDKINVTKIERIRFAGAFGAHIDPEYAMILGMIPDCPLQAVKSVGNAAGTGARIALMNRAARAEIEQQVRLMEKIETATETNFQSYFVAAMAIPHLTDRFVNLEAAVTLPKAAVSSKATRRRRRKRS